MKKQLLSLLLAAAGLLATTATQAQVTRQKVGANPTTIDSSAALDVESTTRGFLPPRMTTAQRNAISGPATGLQIYNTTTGQMEVNTGTTTAPKWTSAGGNTGTALTNAQFAMSGGGNINWDNDSLSWSTRFIIISAGSGNHFSTNGFFDISQPPTGTVIPGFGGAPSVIAQASGIRIQDWTALYYALPVGSSNVSRPDSFRLVNYTAGFVVPDNWVRIAARNADNTTLKLGTGQILKAGQNWYAGQGMASTFNDVPLTATELNIQSKTQADTNAGDGNQLPIATWIRPTTNGVKYQEVAQWRLGTFDQGAVGAQTKLSLIMNNGNTNAVNTTPFVFQANGRLGIGNDGRFPFGTVDVGGYGDSIGVLIRNGQYAVGPKAATTQISFGAGGGTTMRHSISTSYNPYVQMRYNAMRFNIWTTATPGNNNPELTPFIIHGDAGGRIETISRDGYGGMWLDSGCYDCPGYQKAFLGQDRTIDAGTAGNANRHAFGSWVAANGIGWNAFNVYDNGQIAMGTAYPNPSAQLDLSSGNRGFLPPRMGSGQRNAIQFPADGLVIYNTDDKCLNIYQTGVGWYNMCTNSISANGAAAVFASGSQNCGGTLSGTYAAAFSMNSSNTKQVSVTVNTAGAYNVTTNTVNGVVFRAAGTNIGTGAQTITLMASGNPTAAGTFTYVVTFASGITCQFAVTYVDEATFTAGTQNCGGTLAGSYNQGNPTNASNTKTVSITVATTGSYRITTDVQNGVSFSGQGTFTSTGAQSIVLTASGTPTAAGTFTYTVPFTTTGISCTFNVTYNAGVSAVAINCAGGTVSASLGGNTGAIKFVNGTAYSGTITIPYTGGNSTSYGADVQTYAGLTYSRPAGTFTSGSGNLVWNVSGTYTGVTGAQTYVRLYPGNGGYCDYRIGDGIRGALTNAASINAYDAAAVNSWVNITAAEYAALRTTVRGIGIGGASDADLTNTSASTTSGTNVTVGGCSTHADITSTYIVGFAVMPGAGGQSTSGMRVKHAPQVNSGYVAYGAALPAVTSTANTPLYFVIKKPNAGTYNNLGAYTPSTFSIRTFGSANYNTGAGDIANPSTTVNNGTLQMQAMHASEYQW